MLVGCATQNRYQAEAQAYQEYLSSEVRAGKLTPEQARYLMAQKVNQLHSQMNRDNASSDAAAIMLGTELMRQGQPYRLPSRSTNCVSTRSGENVFTDCY